MLKCIDRRGVSNTNWAQYTSTVTINPLRADINTAVTVFGLQRLTPNSVRRILSPPYAAPHLQRTTGAAVAELSTGGTRASLSSLTQSRSSFWLPGMPDKGVHRLSFKWAGKPSSYAAWLFRTLSKPTRNRLSDIYTVNRVRCATVATLASTAAEPRPPTPEGSNNSLGVVMLFNY